VNTQAYWLKKNYKPKKGGVVYYSQNYHFFDSSAIVKRKHDATSKMINFCSPEKPVILSQSHKEKVVGTETNYRSSFFNSTLNSTSITNNVVRNLMYINFECE